MSTQEEQSQAETRRKPLREFFEHQKRAYAETGKALESLLPEGFRKHSGEAGKEFFASFKVLFDVTVDGLETLGKEIERVTERRQSADKPATTGAGKVKVEVE